MRPRARLPFCAPRKPCCFSFVARFLLRLPRRSWRGARADLGSGVRATRRVAARRRRRAPRLPGHLRRAPARPPPRAALPVPDLDRHARRAAARGAPTRPWTRAPATYRALLGGLRTTAAVIAHDGAQSGVQLQLSPLGARALLGVPAGELAGIDLDAADLLGRLADDLHEQMRAAPSPGPTGSGCSTSAALAGASTRPGGRPPRCAGPGTSCVPRRALRACRRRRAGGRLERTAPGRPVPHSRSA